MYNKTKKYVLLKIRFNWNINYFDILVQFYKWLK